MTLSAPEDRTMSSRLYSLRAQRLGVVLGVVSLPLFTIGFVVLAGFIPPPRPTDSAEAIARVFIDRKIWIQTGMVVCQTALVLWVPWGVAVACRTRMAERTGFPVIAYVQLVSTAIVVGQLVITTTVWAVLAFRPNEVPVDIIRTLNDFGWFMFLFLFAPLTLWVASLVPAVLAGDRAAESSWPRWVGYFSVWVAVLLIPGAALQYFKAGPLAWNGIVPCYIPFAAFFLWFGIVSVYAYRAISDDITAVRYVYDDEK